MMRRNMVNVKHSKVSSLLPAALLICVLNGLTAFAGSAEFPDYYYPNSTISTNGIVRAVMFFEGKLYVGGNFTKVTDKKGTYDRTDLAAYDTATGLVTSFKANTNTGTVRAIAAKKGTIYAGGSFTQINRVSCSKVAALDPATGAVITRFSKNQGTVNGSVWALAVSDSTLYLGGDFTTVDGSPRNYLAAMNADSGTLVQTFNPSPSDPFDDSGRTPGGVYALEMHPDNPAIVFAGGNFLTVAGLTDRPYLVALNSDGTPGPAFEGLGSSHYPITDLDANGPYCYAGIGGWGNRVMSFRIDAEPYVRQWSSVWVNGDVQAIACAPQGYIYFGCHDGVLDSSDDNRLAVLNANTGLIYDIYPQMNSFFGVRALEMAGNWLAVGGEFTQMNGISQKYLAIFNKFPFSPDGILPPATPVLASPTDSMTGVSLSPSLQWKFAAHAETYELQVAADSLFSNIVYSKTGLTQYRQRCSGLKNTTEYRWHVRASNSIGTSDWSAAWLFGTVPGRDDIPKPAFPANGALDQPVATALGWHRTATARSYHIQVSATPDSTALVFDRTGITDTTVTVSGLANAAMYYWRVNALTVGGESDWSSFWTFTTVPGQNDIPILAQPVNGATNQPTMLSLFWHPTNSAQSYGVQLSTSPDFIPLLIGQGGITDTSLLVAGLANNTAYYWRVNVLTINGEYVWSLPWTFTTVPARNDIPVLAQPIDGAIAQPVTLPLCWHPVISAQSYGLQFSSAPDFTPVLLELNGITDTFFTVTALGHTTAYYWRVNAKTAGVLSEWSLPWKFTTIPGSYDIPVIASPVDGTIDQPIAFNFTWHPTASAISYGIQLVKDSGDQALLLDLAGIVDTSFGIVGLENNTLYHWRINALTPGGPTGWASAGFRTIVGSPRVPRCIAPADNASQCPLRLTLRWETVENTTSYRVQVSTDSTFTTLMYDAAGFNDPALVIAGLTEDTRYFWRVNCSNAFGNTWSNPARFRTVFPLPGAPFPIAPVCGRVATTDSLRLVWKKSSPYVTRYRIEIARDSAMQAHVLDTMTTDTAFIRHHLEDKTAFWWRVWAYNESGWSVSSETRFFRTLFPPSIAYIFSLDGFSMSGKTNMVAYRLAEQCDVHLELFDLRGKSIDRMTRANRPAGMYRDRFPANKLSVGSYLLFFKAGQFTQTAFIILTK
jgi:hypothetical protein